MAIYHASIRPPVTRSTGRSATAAAAYRAGCIVVDTRTGEIHDYTRKRGVMHADILLPGGGQAPNRAEFWNRVEAHHKRGDAVVARELVAAIPEELPPYEQIQLAREMGAALSNEYGVAVDVCVHEPSRGGDDRNTHVHFLMTACLVSSDGRLGKKCELLDPIHCKRNGCENAAEWIRPVWQQLANDALANAGSDARIDHRSHAARGLTEVPGSHHGPAVTEILRSGRDSDVADRIAAEAAAVIARQQLDAQAAAELLEAQAAQALAELEIELEIERLQAAAEREAAEREAQARSAAERLQAVKDAEQALAAREAAQRAVDAAERQRQALWPAYDQAVSGQREAGRSLVATARAVPKIGVWRRAIEAYGAAFEALELAQKVLQRAGEKLAAALAKLEMLDPAVRERREAREAQAREAYQDQQRRIAASSAAAAAAHARSRQRGGQVAAHQHQEEPQDDDQERAPDVPRM